jgi:xanthine dehydrogenase/oxidase
MFLQVQTHIFIPFQLHNINSRNLTRNSFIENIMAETTSQNTLTFYLDGEKITLTNVSPKTRLIDYLHQAEVGKGGTKLSCGQGGCGACTVMVTAWDSGRKAMVHKAINACLRPVATLDGMMITTTQGIGNIKDGVDEVQWKIAYNNGSQCGYCTPGFTMHMFAALQQKKEMTTKEIEDLFDGNICRCTGYRPILDGFKQFGSDYEPPSSEAEIEVDPYYAPPCKKKPTVEIVPPKAFIPYMKKPKSLLFEQGDYTYARPTTLKELYTIMSAHGPVGEKFRLVSGNTAKGIYATSPVYNESVLNQHYFADVSFIPELQEVKQNKNDLVVGAQITVTRLIEVITGLIETLPEYQSTGLKALKEHMKVVANEQIRNEASLAGNLFIGTNMGFLSDIVLTLGTLGAVVKVTSAKQTKEYPVLEIPLTSKLSKDAIYHSIRIPFTRKNEYVKSFKIRKRLEDCHATVNAGYRVLLDAKAQVKESFFVVNGVDADYKLSSTKYGLKFAPVHLKDASNVIKGQKWDAGTLKKALASIRKEVKQYTPPKLKGKYVEIGHVPFSYRAMMSETLFYKFYVSVALEINEEVPRDIASVADGLPDPKSFGMQKYNSYPEELPVSAPIVKLAAFMQATGEAKYSTDVEQPANTLESSFIYSLIARGTWNFILPGKKKAVTADELSEYLKGKFPDFTTLVTYEDIAKENRVNNWVGFGSDDPIFVPAAGTKLPKSIKDAAAESNKKGGSKVFHPDELTSVGAPIGLVVAKNRTASQEISVFVRNNCIHFKTKNALDFETAYDKKHYFPQSPSTNAGATHIEHVTRPGSSKKILTQLEKEIANLSRSNVKESTSSGKMTAGAHETGYQNHFYMETMVTLAVPGENHGMKLYASTQNAADNQSVAAKILGVHTSSVRVLLQREGGGFGGRQSRSRFISTAAALAAWKLNRPVRLQLDRNTNFIMCGNRHPFYAKYATKANKDGTIDGLHIDYVSNGGNTYDMSFPVMDLAVLSADNVYNIDTFKITGNVCQTNQISSTAFRSFGMVQGINIVEEVIEHTAFNMGIAPEELREKNFYKDGTVEWTSFEITTQTLGILKSHPYGFDKDTLASLEKMKGKLYETEEIFDAAIIKNKIEGLLGPQNLEALITLKDFSTTSYDYAPYLQGLKWNNINVLWSELKKSSGFEGRREGIAAFNEANRFRKRGMSMIPLKYGVSYTGPRGTLNQGGAYVKAYAADGTVLLHHGGVEMGQGIMTKMAQIAAETLDIPIDLIKVTETDTNIISDASPTAASTGSDLNGGAVQKACLILRERLEQFCIDLEENSLYFANADTNPADADLVLQIKTVVRNWRDHWSEVWPIVIALAYTGRVGLSAEARYKTPHYQAVADGTPYGRPFFYYTYAAAVSEVEIDVLTGEHVILRSDILFDVGKSLNPLIDVGQIEGGFVQGVGYVTTEEMLVQGPHQAPVEGLPDDAFSSVNTWEYKPPGAKSIPRDFRVSIFDASKEVIRQKGPRLEASAVKSSKGIGEPPLVLGNTVFFAIKQAILSFYKQEGYNKWVELTAPATTQKIQTACKVTGSDLTLSAQKKIKETV